MQVFYFRVYDSKLVNELIQVLSSAIKLWIISNKNWDSSYKHKWRFVQAQILKRFYQTKYEQPKAWFYLLQPSEGKKDTYKLG